MLYLLTYLLSYKKFTADSSVKIHLSDV